jgi:hypothetical protein
MPPPLASREIILRSPGGHDVLRLRALRRDAGYPSLEVRVEGTAKGFSGGGDVWIDGFELKAFVATLRVFEKGRQGHVELHAMDPDLFRLVLRSTDHAGHLLVEFTIARPALVGDTPEPAPFRVSAAFELDAGTLGEISGGFTQLANALAA